MRMINDKKGVLGHSMPVDDAIDYSRRNNQNFREELFDLIRFPSVGTSPDHLDDTIATANWLVQAMQKAGLENVGLKATSGMPLVYGEWLHAGIDRPTVLIYGHYDVQPAEPLGEWKSSPFEPTIIDQYVYGRGAADDKGQLFIHLKAIESYLKSSGQLPINIKCIIEGEEEHGSGGINNFVVENKSLLASDAIIISDTAMISPGKPAIVYATRGMCYILLDITGARRDLHSGSFGGVIDNPINVLSHIISKLKTEDGRILIPGFYDQVREIGASEQSDLAGNLVAEQVILEETGAPTLWGEPDYSLNERLGVRPTLDVNGVSGGFTGEGTKTIIPSCVHAKISMRLVPDQKPQEIYDLFKEYVYQVAPPSVKVEITFAHGGDASLLDVEGKATKAACSAYASVFGTGPVFVREGGTIPIVAVFKEQLGIDSVMMGFGLPDDRIHAPNERFYLPNYYRGIETSIRFMDIYGHT